jgi:hypothetical protein
MPAWLYALACVAVPCGIGTVMYVLFGAWDRRRSKKAQDVPVVEYFI